MNRALIAFAFAALAALSGCSVINAAVSAGALRDPPPVPAPISPPQWRGPTGSRHDYCYLRSTTPTVCYDRRDPWATTQT